MSHNVYDGRLRRSDPGLVSSLVLGSIALMIAAGAVSANVIFGILDWPVALAFGTFIAVGAFVRLRLPGDRDVWPVASAGALAYALLPTFGGKVTTYHAYQVVTVVVVALFVGMIPHLMASRLPALDLVTRQILVVTVAASAFRPAWAGTSTEESSSWKLLAYMLAIATLAWLTDSALAGMVRASRTRAPFGRTFSDELRATFGINTAVAATGVMMALSAGVMSYWALPVFGVQLVLVQFAFKRYAAIRATYRQTIRALSRVTEVGGYNETGHARRVCDLSLTVGREMGMSENELLDLEYAALMHDIGQLSLVTPIPGGATVVAAPYEQRQIAEKGAAVIVQTGVLDSVAHIVGHQADPYRRPHEAVDYTVPLASRIIKAVNAYDDLVGGTRDSGRRFDALERLRLGMAYDYDPRVVETLSRIVERNTPLGV